MVLRGAGSNVVKSQPSMSDSPDPARIPITDSETIMLAFSTSAKAYILANNFEVAVWLVWGVQAVGKNGSIVGRSAYGHARRISPTPTGGPNVDLCVTVSLRRTLVRRSRTTPGPSQQWCSPGFCDIWVSLGVNS
jgi:hypothetical protein